MGGQAHGFSSHILINASYLYDDSAWLNHRHPMINGAFTLAHSRFGSPFSDGLIGKDPYPYLRSALDMTDDGPSGSFDLTAGHPAGLQSLKAIVAKGHRSPP
jgi:hypothetical protein